MRWTFSAEADQAEQKWCQHAICRRDQADDLVYLGRALGRVDLLELASQAPNSTVRCRLQPRKGPVRAPLPRNGYRERIQDPVQLCDIPLPPRRAT